MKALVFGATGFLGYHVMRRLLDEGHEVRVVLRATSLRSRLDGLSVDVCVGDVMEPASIANAAAGCDWVFHAAGRVSLWAGDADAMRREHVLGARNVANACRRARARLVYTSSVAALGPPRPDGAIGDETTPFDWDGLRHGYAAAKREAEDCIRIEVAAGLDAVLVQPATTFGTHDVNFSVARMIAETDAGRMMIYPPGGLTVAHAESVGAGHIAAARYGRSGEAYVLGGDHLPLRDLLTLIARQLGRRPPWLPVGPRLLRVFGAGGELASSLVGRDLGLTATTAALACRHLYYSSAKAMREIGYRPLPASDAIEAGCRWYREQTGRLPAAGAAPTASGRGGPRDDARGLRSSDSPRRALAEVAGRASLRGRR